MLGASMIRPNALLSETLFVSKCCVVCLQETKLAFTSTTKFRTICGFYLQNFRSLDAIGTKGGVLTAWNPSLFDCIEDRAGIFSLSVVLRRKCDGRKFTISNIYGPTCACLRANFFQELRHLGQISRGAWVAIGDFNVLLSRLDKNGPPSHTNDMLLFRVLVSNIGLFDLPLLNKSYTWTNGRWNPTLERLDRAFISKGLASLFSQFLPKSATTAPI